MIDVAIIIVSWNVRDYLSNCLRSVCTDLHASKLTGEIWVVDNASTDGTVDLVRDLFPHVKIIANDDNPRLRRGQQPGHASRGRI